MAWKVDASGTIAAVIGTEQVLDAPSGAFTYEFGVDLSNLAMGDAVELRVYKAMISGGTPVQVWLGRFADLQVNPGAQAPPIALPFGGKFTLKQTAGTARNFNYEVSRA